MATITIDMIDLDDEVPDCEGSYLCRFDDGKGNTDSVSIESFYLEELDIRWLQKEDDFCPSDYTKQITHWAAV